MSTLAAADLVRRIAAGEEQAEAQLVERCGSTLRFLTRRFTRHEADADRRSCRWKRGAGLWLRPVRVFIRCAAMHATG